MATNKPTNPLGTTPYLFHTGTLTTAQQADASKMTNGWNTAGEKPKRNHQNGLFKFLTQFTQHVNDYGVPHWDTDSGYLAGSWARSTVDNKVYVCILDADNTRGEPSVTATYWISLESSLVPAGKVDYFAMSTAPAGYLKANGAIVLRSTYPALFAAISTTYNIGSGGEDGTNFRLPDLRGEFIRGWDDSRGIDSGRTLASAQSSQNLAHTHDISLDKGENDSSGSGSDLRYLGTPEVTITTASSGGSEARPRNIALLACIKF